MTHQLVDIGGLLTRPPFSTLFTINPTTRDAIVDDMRDKQFDASKPIDVWRGENVVVDGHTRLDAARILGIEDIPIYLHEFDDELAALAYAIHNQRDRRNLTNTEIVSLAKLLDETRRQHQGGNRNPTGSNQYTDEVKASTDALTSAAELTRKSAAETGAILGVSTSTIERARMIYDDPDAIAEVASGVGIQAVAARKRGWKYSQTNGHTDDLPGAKTDWSTVARPTIDETTPTFRSREHGMACRANAERLEMVVAERLALAIDQGLDLREIVANDRDVRKVWREAAQASLRAYKEIRAISGDV